MPMMQINWNVYWDLLLLIIRDTPAPLLLTAVTVQKKFTIICFHVQHCKILKLATGCIAANVRVYWIQTNRTGQFLPTVQHGWNLWLEFDWKLYWTLLDGAGKPQKLFHCYYIWSQEWYWEPHTYFLSVNLVIAPGPPPACPTHTCGRERPGPVLGHPPAAPARTPPPRLARHDTTHASRASRTVGRKLQIVLGLLSPVLIAVLGVAPSVDRHRSSE